ncbi:MAG: septal ring lytic transglycosylase RlpA family protein [Pseudomonadota bacterium]
MPSTRVASVIAVSLLTACSTSSAVGSGGTQVGANGQMAVSTPLICSGASYYSDSLAGNSTASGEPYDPAKLTAAHRTLPFGTKVRVVRAGRGEVVVTINDRGPFVDGRVIDLSRAAAEKVDLISDGIGDVCLYEVD